MKKIIVLVVMAVAVAFAYQQFLETDFSSANLSPEQKIVRNLDRRIDQAGQQIGQAGRTAGLSGLDSTSEVESALAALERIESEIRTLKQQTDSEEIRRECERLQGKVAAARR